MRKRTGIVAIAVLLLLMLGVSGYSYESERTPEYALKELMDGIESRDEAKVARYADLDQLVSTSYDETTDIVARDIERLRAEYPDDWFFRHDTAFMEDYIKNRRNDDIVFIHRALELFFDPDIAPVGKMDGSAKWCADEADKFTKCYSAKLVSVDKKGKDAIATIELTGDDRDYGRLVPKLDVKLLLEPQEDGRYKVTRVTNIAEEFDTGLKGVEEYCTMKGLQ